MGETCAQIDPNWREPVRWKLRRIAQRLWRPIHLYFYCRFIYRHHMRLIHRFNRHWVRRIGPIEPNGAIFYRCEWCGEHKPKEGADHG
jgi:hypothetical protein